jgi:hypothetical protein
LVAVAIKQAREASPEGQLKKAQANAEAAKKTAEEAAEAYNDLSDSLASLGDQYKTLDKLRKGTEEWNKAVLNIN